MVSCDYPDSDMLFGEPTLEELLAEPIIQLFMKRDGVDEDDMRGQIDRVQQAYSSLSHVQ